MNSKAEYFLSSLWRYFSENSCPSCGCGKVKFVDRKYIVTRLFECNKCRLMFRHPKDSILFNREFYQKAYDQKGGITTYQPNDIELKILVDNQFKGTNKSIVEFVKILSALNLDYKGLKITDYGSSWGYMTYQFLQKGYEVDSFEISSIRADFGNKHLGLTIKTEENDLLPNRDVFFSSHVIEHVPSVADMIQLSKKLLNDAGFFIAECPNGSDGFIQNNFDNFHKLWGLVHPNVISDIFYKTAFINCPYIIASTPYDENVISKIRNWNRKDQLLLDTSGPQLLVIAKVNDVLE